MCRNETIKCTARNERCMDDSKKVLNNDPCDNEPCDVVNINREKSTDIKRVIMNHAIMNRIIMILLIMKRMIINLLIMK